MLSQLTNHSKDKIKLEPYLLPLTKNHFHMDSRVKSIKREKWAQMAQQPMGPRAERWVTLCLESCTAEA